MVIQCLGCGQFFKGRSALKCEQEYDAHLITCKGLMDIDKMSDEDVMKLAKIVTGK